MKKCCANCDYWKRDGNDGICQGGKAPDIKWVRKNERAYDLMRPRTNPDDRCRDFEPIKED